MKVPFTWKVTGWFMIGWSPEFPVGETRPLRYFGEDLVAYRDTDGELHVLGHDIRRLSPAANRPHESEVCTPTAGTRLAGGSLFGDPAFC